MSSQRNDFELSTNYQNSDCLIFCNVNYVNSNMFLDFSSEIRLIHIFFKIK